MNIKTVALLFLLALGGYADQAAASVGITLQCFECTPQQMAAMANADLEQRGPHAPPVYVIDWSDATVKKYVKFNNMTPEWNPETDPLLTWNEEVPVETIVADNIVAIRQLTPAVKIIIREVVNADNTNATAFDVIDNQHVENAVGRYLNEQSGLGIRGAYQQLGGAILPWVDPSYLVKVVFSDGSSVVYKWDDGDYVKVDGMAKDKNGNLIPEKYDEFADGGIETYYFLGAGDPAAQLFYERASLMNIIISPPSVNQIFAYVCVAGPEQIECRIQVM